MIDLTAIHRTPTGRDEPPSDTLLLERMAQRDAAALRALVDRYGGAVFSLAVHILEDGPDAEVVTEQVFADAWQDAATFNPERSTVVAWLLGLTRRRAILRRRARERGVDTLPPEEAVGLDPPAPARQPELTSLGTDARQRLRAAWRALPLTERLPLELAYFHGLTDAEIARRLEMPADIVRGRIRRALVTLRGALSAQPS